MGTRKRERLLVIMALLGLGAFAGDRMVLNPAVGLWRAQAERITFSRQQLAKGALLLERKDSLEGRWEEMRRESLPGDYAEAGSRVLDAVGTWAAESNLQIDTIKPRWVDREDLNDMLELRLSGRGDLGALSRFLYSLEVNPMSLRVEDVEIRAQDERGRDLTLEARITGLVLGEVE